MKDETKTEVVLTSVPKDMEVVKPVEGKLSTEQWQSFVNNLLSFALPLYVGFLLTQLIAGVEIKTALLTSLVSLYSPLADYLKKRNNNDAYLREKQIVMSDSERLSHAIEQVHKQQSHRVAWQEADDAERIANMLLAEAQELVEAVVESLLSGDVFPVASEIGDLLYLCIRFCQFTGLDPADVLDMKTKRNSKKYDDAVCNNGYSPQEATRISKEGWRYFGGDKAFSHAYLDILADVEENEPQG